MNPVPESVFVRDQLEQAAVRVAEVDAAARAAGSEPFDRPELDLDPESAQALHRGLDRTVPDEAEVAVTGADRIDRTWMRLAPRTVNVQLLRAEPVRPPPLVQ